MAGSGVDRSWADSSTSTRRQPETAGQAPRPRSGTPQATGHLLAEFDHADVAFGAVVVRWYPLVGREALVVLAVAQPPGERVVLAHQLAGPRRGLGEADLRGRA